MGSLFKPKFKRHYDRKTGKVVKKGHPDAELRDYRAKKWYGRYRDHLGIIRRVPLHKNKEIAQQDLIQLERDTDNLKRGTVDRFAKHRKTALSEHREMFRISLKAKGRDPSYVIDTVRYVRLVSESCGFIFLSDINSDSVEQFANDLRDTPAALKKLNNSKAENAELEGRSARTVNAYVAAMKGFCQWCVTTGRAPDNPLAHLAKLNEQTDIRLERRTLSNGELIQLIDAAESSEVTFRQLTGPYRAILYKTALGTGFRANELASLTADSLSLKDNPPLITLEASKSKRRRIDRQPLPSWLAEQLGVWLRSRELKSVLLSGAGSKLWPGSWAGRAAEMLRIDLAVAKIPYVDSAGHTFDFHALRHQYITSLTTGGLHPKMAQQLARHSSIDLTMKRYTHLNLHDVAGAVEQVADPTTPKQIKSQATGTDDRAIVLRSGCAAGVKKGVEMSPNGKLGKIVAESPETKKTSVIAEVFKAEGMGLEPTTLYRAPEFQSGR